MSESLREQPWIQVITAVSSVVFGLVISPIFERVIDPAFDTPTRALLSGFTLLGLLLIAGMTAIGIYVKQSEQQNQAVSNRLETIDMKLGLDVEFIEDPLPFGKGIVYDRVRELVEQAQESIVVLSRGTKSVTKVERKEVIRRSPEDQEARTKYMASLLTKAKENKHRPRFYRRIRQYDDGKGHFTLEWDDEDWIRHYRTMVDLQEQYGCVEVKVAKTFFPQNLIIVDGRHIMLIIDAYDVDRGKDRRYGALYFYDPSQKLVKVLQSIVDYLELNPRLAGEPPQQWEWEDIE